MSYLNLAAIRFFTDSEGPGHRVAIWVQGCPRRCPDCCNPEMQSLEPKFIVDTKDLLDLIDRETTKNPVEGVSLIGGEPIWQAGSLCEIAEWFQRKGLSVLMFTGFLYEELLEMNEPQINKLLSLTDLLIDGEFIESEPDLERPWIGSRNQKVYRLSDFYPAGIEYKGEARRLELLVSKDEILINGWPYPIQTD